nr:MAG TPA_asm: hypothetical protein [Bacteriophage sp.]
MAEKTPTRWKIVDARLKYINFLQGVCSREEKLSC